MRRTPVALLAATAARLANLGDINAPAAPSHTSDLKHQLKTRDVRLTIPTRDRLVTVSFVSTRNLFAETLARHELLTRTAGYLPFLEMIGTQLSFTHLLASPLSGEERVEVRLTTDEATIHSSALALGEGVAYVRPTNNAEMLEQGGTCAPFPLRVDRILYNQHQPFSSVVSASLDELLPLDETIRDQAARRLTTPPLSLELAPLVSSGAITTEGMQRYFCGNSTLHAYNHARRSDGTPSAVWMQSRLSPAALIAARLLDAEGSPTEKNHLLVPQSQADVSASVESLAALKGLLASAVPVSFGVQLTPLAAGPAVEWQLWALQRALVAASVTAAAAHSPLSTLIEAAQDAHTTCQAVLSLVTGDVEGAYAVAKRHRQYTCDPAVMARMVEPVRDELGIAAECISLDADVSSRTPLDFHCRCSKEGLLRSFLSIPQETLESLTAQPSFACTTCGKHHLVSPEDWTKLREARAAAKS